MHLRKTRGIVFVAALVAGCSGGVDPSTSMWGDSPGNASDPNAAAQPPANGQPVVDPVTGQTTVVDPITGQTTVTDPVTGQTTVVDPVTGQTTVVDPVTGQTTVVDPTAAPAATTPPALTTADPAISTAPAAACAPGTPKTTQLPRLTNVQYDNTIKELIGVDLGLSATTLAQDSKGDMDARTWLAYQTAASTLATTVTSNATARAAVIPCTTQDVACAQQVITDFGAKAFRRPLTGDEVAKYVALFNDTSLSATGTFDEQMQVVLEALFQSPYFLSLAEVSETPTDGPDGTRYALDDYELASRLSYLLWDSMPDGTLFAAAAAGTLTSGTGLADQAVRMLQDDRAKGLVERLHKDYLHMGANTRWEGYTRDASLYPAYNPNQIGAVGDEALKVAESVVFNGGTFQDLMTTTVGFVNADTAPLYGLDPAQFGPELQQVDLGPERPGLLTRAGFLAANSYTGRTSPIYRGAFIEKEVLCTTLGNPAANAASTPLPSDPNLVTNRQKTDAQTAAEEGGCKGCHQTIINPAGFAFEGFDAVGGVQTMDNGVPVDTAADVLVGSKVVSVAGAQDLMAAIAVSPEAQRCYTQSWVETAYNRVLAAPDVCTVDEIAQKMAQPGYTVINLITDLTQVESFRYRALETEVAQ